MQSVEDNIEKIAIWQNIALDRIWLLAVDSISQNIALSFR